MGEIITVILALLGALLNANKRIEGFYFWIAANVIGAWILYEKEMYYMAGMYILFAGTAVWGIKKWSSTT